MWCDESASLLWVDILAGKLLRYWPASQRTEIHEMPRFTSAVLLTQTPEVFLLISQSGILRYDFATRAQTLLCPWPADDTRPNEAAIAPDGALWFSSMDPDARRIVGSWYRLAHAGAHLQVMLSDQWVPNTLQWFDGYLWFADSLRKRFYCAKEHDGTLHIEHEWPVDGIPDGSALTCDGTLINALWGCARLVYAALHHGEMTIQGELPLPARQPSSCAFGGAERSDLFMTSALDGLAHPGESDGALFTIKTTFTGMPANRFRL